jgi:hypothetical protein
MTNHQVPVRRQSYRELKRLEAERYVASARVAVLKAEMHLETMRQWLDHAESDVRKLSEDGWH